jgi:hypothetical protein
VATFPARPGQAYISRFLQLIRITVFFEAQPALLFKTEQTGAIYYPQAEI